MREITIVTKTGLVKTVKTSFADVEWIDNNGNRSSTVEYKGHAYTWDGYKQAYVY